MSAVWGASWGTSRRDCGDNAQIGLTPGVQLPAARDLDSDGPAVRQYVGFLDTDSDPDDGGVAEARLGYAFCQCLEQVDVTGGDDAFHSGDRFVVIIDIADTIRVPVVVIDNRQVHRDDNSLLVSFFVFVNTDRSDQFQTTHENPPQPFGRCNVWVFEIAITVDRVHKAARSMLSAYRWSAFYGGLVGAASGNHRKCCPPSSAII